MCDKCKNACWPSGLPKNPDLVLLENHPDPDPRRWPSGLPKHPDLWPKNLQLKDLPED